MAVFRHFKTSKMFHKVTPPGMGSEIRRRHPVGGFSTKVVDADHTKLTADLLFDKFRTDDGNRVSVGKFLTGLKRYGLRESDPRLAGLMENLKKLHTYTTSGSTHRSPTTLKLTKEEFVNAINPCLPLLTRAFRNDFIMPHFTQFVQYVEENYWKCKSNTEGRVADYIPQLAKVNPNYWGVSLCTVDGQRCSFGDVTIPFTIQSTSKPLTYGIALDLLTQEVVHQYVGQEPSGRNFNEIVLDHNDQPHNPMVNSGAIVICSLLKSLVHPNMTQAEKFDFTKNIFQRMTGGEYIGFNNAIFLSERGAADRNYALGFFMREHKCFPRNTNLREVMDFYFQCCSMEATADSLAVAAATLANGGICPLTEDRVLKPECVRDVLSLMHSCGMYDYSGQFAFRVGLPAKSGVSGATMVVIPNVLGICTWSPPLDQLGNSVRSVQFCEEAIMKLELFNPQQQFSDNLMNILAENPRMTQPELVREVNARKFRDVKKVLKRNPFQNRSLRQDNPEGFTLINLLFASAAGDISALRMHWLSGTDMSEADYDGRTALHLACAEGHLECTKFLVQQCKVPPDAKDRWGNTPISEAHNFKRVQIVEFLNKWAGKQTSEKISPTNKSGPSDPQKGKPEP